MSKCSDCSFNLPSKQKQADIMILGEYPTEYEYEKNKLFCDLKGNIAVRNIVRRLSDKYKFTYHYSTVYKKPTEKLTPNLISKCSECLKKELNQYNPKVIITLGNDICNYIYPSSNGILIEEGCVRNLELFSRKYNIISTVDPNWCIKVYPNIVGLIYTAIEKAILFSKGISFNIRNKFESNLITSVKEVKKLLNDFSNTEEYVAVDTEAESLGRIRNTVISIQLSNDGKNGYLIPLRHFDSPFNSKELEEIDELLRNFFTRKTKVKGYIYHNSKFDLHQFFRDLKVIIHNAPIIDTLFSEYLHEENYSRVSKIYPKGKRPYTLFNVSYRYGFNYYIESDSKDDRANLSNLKIKSWLKYGCADVVSIWQIYKKQLYLAKIRGHKKYKLMSEEYSTSVYTALTYVEHCGIPVHIETLREMTNPLYSPITKQINIIKEEFKKNKNVIKLNKMLMKKRSGVEYSIFGDSSLVDIGSSLHRQQLFYGILELQPIENPKKKNKETKSVDKKFFAKYKDTVPEVGLVAEYQRLKTLQSGQIDTIYKFMNKTTGNPDFYLDNKIRASYMPNTVTGRLMAFKPNPQQRVSRGDRAKDILKMYKARKKKFIAKLDQGTFEVRGLGIISGDKVLMGNFNKMDETFEKYRQDFSKFVNDKKKPKNLRDYLFRVLDEYFSDKKVESEKIIELVNNQINRFDKINEEVFSKVKDSFCNYVSAIIKEKESWELEELKSTINKAVKYELLRLIANDIVASLTDIHKFSASLFNNIAIEKVSKKQRQDAKGLVFGSIYGRGAESIAQELGITQEEALALQQKFANNMPTSFEWLSNIPKFGYENLYVESPIGRRRHVWGFLFVPEEIINIQYNDNREFYIKLKKLVGEEQYTEAKYLKRIYAEVSRLCMNAPIQGMCSDFQIIGTYLLVKEISKLGKLKYQVTDEEAWFIHNLVHDSMEGEFPKKDFNQVMEVVEPIYTHKLVKYIEDTYGFKIEMNFRIDFEFGLDYANMSKWDGTEMEAERIKKLIEREN